MELTVEKSIESILESKFGRNDQTISTNIEKKEEAERILSVVVYFNGFEDFIQLSQYLEHAEVKEGVDDILYNYEGNYLLHLEFSPSEYEEDEQNNMTSKVMVFANKSTEHTLL